MFDDRIPVNLTPPSIESPQFSAGSFFNLRSSENPTLILTTIHILGKGHGITWRCSTQRVGFWG